MQETILRNLKTNLGNYCTLCTDQKNLQSNSIKVWLTLFKNTENSKTSETHRFKLDLTDKLNLENSNKTWLWLI